MIYTIQPEIRISRVESVIEYIEEKVDTLVLTSKPISQKNNLESVFSTFDKRPGRFQFIDDVPDENPFSYIAQLYGKLDFSPGIIIAIGGGSVIDLAKAMSVAKDFEELEALFYKKREIAHKYSRVYAFPTTFGTGAELSFGSILFDDARDIKSGIRGPLVQPSNVFLDFRLYQSAPQRVKSLAGYDCLTHAIETYLSKKSTELTRVQSVTAINIVFRYLESAVSNEPNAIRKMAIASMLMGINLAYSTTCLPHRLQYVIGPMTHTSHSEGLAALYKGYLPFITSQRSGPISALCTDLDLSRNEMHDRINALKHQLDISLSLSDLGITGKEFGHIMDHVTGNLSDDPYYKDNSTIEHILKLAL